MGLFHKLTFFDALEILDCDSLSAQQKKKIIKAESHFTEDEKSACYMLFCLHKGDCGSALYFINRTQQGEKLPGVMMAALYTHIAFRKFSEAHEEDPSYPDYIAYLALAYKHGFFCKKDHSKAVETAEPLRSSEATGALVKQALKDIFLKMPTVPPRTISQPIPLRVKKRRLPQSPIRSRLLPSSLLRQRYGKKKKFRYICIPIPTRYSAKYSFPTEIFIPENSIRTMRVDRYCTDTVKCAMPTERPGTANGTTI